MPRKAILTPEETQFLCPKCGSAEKCRNGYARRSWGYPTRYKCKTCGAFYIMEKYVRDLGELEKETETKIKVIVQYLTYEYSRDIGVYNRGTHQIEFHRHCCVNWLLKRSGISKYTFYSYLREAIQNLKRLDITKYPQYLSLLKRVSKVTGTGTKKVVKIIRGTMNEKEITELIQILFKNN